MKERGILFSAPMVNAQRAGRKTQTRRLVTLREFQPSRTRGYDWTFRNKRGLWQDYRHADFLARVCPYGVVGDRFWVRETWRPRVDVGHGYYVTYAADGAEQWFPYGVVPPRWKLPQASARGNVPGIHMPRWASRILLEVTDVRVQRLQEISEEDAKAEGVNPRDAAVVIEEGGGLHPELAGAHRGAFACLWDALNASRAPWKSDPWVWAVTFRVLEGGVA